MSSLSLAEQLVQWKQQAFLLIDQTKLVEAKGLFIKHIESYKPFICFPNLYRQTIARLDSPENLKTHLNSYKAIEEADGPPVVKLVEFDVYSLETLKLNSVN